VKVIFIEDVPNVARAGQTKVVADGYARNYLFPRKFAVLANSNAAAAVEAHLKKIVKQKAIEEAEMAALAKIINGTEIVLKAKVGENERLYGSVTGADIAEELSKTISREIDKRKVDLVEPIRQVGVYDVTIRFTHDITAVVVVTAMSDEPDAVKPERVVKKAEKAEEPKEKAEKKEKPEKKEKKEKKVKPPKEVKEETAEKAEKEEKPAKEKKEKPAKAPKAEKSEEKAENKVEPAHAVKEVKPPKEKKAKPEKAEKEAKPAEEEKKEKKPKAEKKAKKSEAKAEDKE
jgi:large subunit ribosomal protein L9